MHKLLRFYNNNKLLVWKAIGIVAFVIIMIQVLNNIVKKQKENKNNEYVNNVESTSNSQKNDTISESIISNKTVNKLTSESNTEIIGKFMKFCNESKLEEAYALIGDDCKERMYKTKDDFIEKYYKKIFTESKTYSLENFYTNGNYTTYRIKIKNDILVSGREEKEYIEDYFTIFRQNDEYRININGFVGKKTLNKSIEKNDVKIEVLERYLYKDNEIYKLKITNNSDEKLFIDSKENNKNIFLQDTNKVKYQWVSNEVSKEELTINSNDTRTIEIKFSKLYNPDRNTTSINFTNIIKENNNGEKTNMAINIDL